MLSQRRRKARDVLNLAGACVAGTSGYPASSGPRRTLAAARHAGAADLTSGRDASTLDQPQLPSQCRLQRWSRPRGTPQQRRGARIGQTRGGDDSAMAWRTRCVQAEQNDEWQQMTRRSAAVAVTRRSRSSPTSRTRGALRQKKFWRGGAKWTRSTVPELLLPIRR